MPFLVGATSPVLPYWLQVAAVIAAPVLGVLGVLLGAGLTGAREKRAWLRKERLTLYEEFVTQAQSFNAFMGTKARTALRLNDSQRMTEVMSEIFVALKSHPAILVRFRLIAPPNVHRAALEVLGQFMATCLVFPKVFAEQEEFNAVGWDKTVLADLAAIERFTAEAARDLGLPRRIVKEKAKVRELSDEAIRGNTEFVMRTWKESFAPEAKPDPPDGPSQP